MTKESAYELQCIDCNCNDCKHLSRLLDKQNALLAADKILDEETYYIVKDRKKKDIEGTIANLTKYYDLIRDADRKIKKQENKLKVLLADKYGYQGSKAPNQYAICNKFEKEITFIPNTLQLDTQTCFEHRKNKPTTQ